MRFIKYNTLKDAEHAVLASKCVIGLVLHEGRTALIYKTEASSDVMTFVVENLKQQYNFDERYSRNDERLMRTHVSVDPEEILMSST